MPEQSVNPYENQSSPVHEPRWPQGKRVPTVQAVLGTVIGLVGLALVSNQFGNTDRIGFLVVGLGAFLLSTGVSSYFLRRGYAILLGVFAAPLAVLLLFVLYWVCLIIPTALFR